jgi:hypothetical protein
MAVATAKPLTIGAYHVLGRLETEQRHVVRKGDGEDDTAYVIELAPVARKAHDRAFLELERYAKLSHVALERLVDFFEWQGSLALVFERVQGVTLDRLKRYLERDRERLPDAALWYLGWRLIGALAQAHLARGPDGALSPLVHGALSPRSVVVSWDGEVHLCGVCPLSGHDDGATLNEGGPDPLLSWRAPELRRGDPPSAKSDAFSAALLMRSMLAGSSPPRLGVEPSLTLLRPDIPADVARALDRALYPVPAKRPSCAELALRFEGLVQVTEGRGGLRECMELYRALWGLWSTAVPSLGSLGSLPVPGDSADELREARISDAGSDPGAIFPRSGVHSTERLTPRDDELPSSDKLALVSESDDASGEEEAPLTSRSPRLLVEEAIDSATLRELDAEAVGASDLDADHTLPLEGVPPLADDAGSDDVPPTIVAAPAPRTLAPPALPPEEPTHASAAQAASAEASEAARRLPPSPPERAAAARTLPPSAEDEPRDEEPLSPRPSAREDDASAWRWVAFASLAIAAAAVAWHSADPRQAPLPTMMMAPPAPAAPASTTAPAPSPSPSAVTPAAVPATDHLPLVAVSRDGIGDDELQHAEGFLVVKAPIDAGVYVQGIEVGRTNQRHKVLCNRKWLRLGIQPETPQPGTRWLSDGVSVTIVCGALTTVNLKPYSWVTRPADPGR